VGSRQHAAAWLRAERVLRCRVETVCFICLADEMPFTLRKRRHMVAVAEAITTRLGTHGARNPFELNVIEALLSSSVNHFYSRAR